MTAMQHPAQDTTGAGDAPARLGGSGRKLTLVDVVAQSVGFMGPVFSIAFLVPLVMGIISATGKGAGIAAPLSIAIAGIGVLAVAWIVGEYAKRIQAAGALYDYVTDGLGAKLGAAAGFLYYLGVMALGGVAWLAKLAVAGLLLAAFETSIAKMRVFRVGEFLGGALLLSLLGAIFLYVSRGV